MATDAGTQRERLAGLLGVPGVQAAEPAAITSLSGLLDALGPERLTGYRSRLASESTDRVLRAYRQAFVQGQRELSFLCSEALAARHRVPPCFRLDGTHSTARLTDERRFDLLAHDLQWIMAMYPEHWRKAKGGYSGMLHGSSWLAVAEHYLSTKNQHDTWLMVRQLMLAVDQQWHCAILRSAPVKRAAQGLAIRQATVHKAVMERLSEAKPRGSYAAIPTTYERRHNVWLCAEMTDGSPTKTARLYELWTGNAIERSAANKDMEWVRAHVPESRKRQRGLSVISCSRHMMLPRRMYASQTESPAGRAAGNSRRAA